MMRDRIESLGGRRFILAVATGLMTGLLQWFGKLDIQGTAYGLTIGATVAAYITGNVAQKIKGSGTQ